MRAKVTPKKVVRFCGVSEDVVTTVPAGKLI
jgi:hypothetical protein